MFRPLARGEAVEADEELRQGDQRYELLECIELGDLGRPDGDVGLHGLHVGQAAADGISQAKRDRVIARRRRWRRAGFGRPERRHRGEWLG